MEFLSRETASIESRSQFMISSAEGPLEKIVLWRDLKRRINNFSNKHHDVHPKMGVH